ncbi:MAG: hypothetical protein V1676_02140 [Candidatus Diapherotrites archaeon]
MAKKAKVTRKQIDEMIETCIGAVRDGVRMPRETNIYFLRMLKSLRGKRRSVQSASYVPPALNYLLEARNLGLIKDKTQLRFVRAANQVRNTQVIFHRLTYAGAEGHIIRPEYIELFGDSLYYVPLQEKIDMINRVRSHGGFRELIALGRELEYRSRRDVPLEGILQKVREKVDHILANRSPVKPRKLPIQRKRK